MESDEKLIIVQNNNEKVLKSINDLENLNDDLKSKLNLKEQAILELSNEIEAVERNTNNLKKKVNLMNNFLASRVIN